MNDIVLTQKQVKALEFLWFKYGNGGSSHTNANHKFMQKHIEGNSKDAGLYITRITKACKEAFERVLNNDYSEFHPNQLRLLEHGWSEGSKDENKCGVSKGK